MPGCQMPGEARYARARSGDHALGPFGSDVHLHFGRGSNFELTDPERGVHTMSASTSCRTAVVGSCSTSSCGMSGTSASLRPRWLISWNSRRARAARLVGELIEKDAGSAPSSMSLAAAIKDAIEQR